MDSKRIYIDSHGLMHTSCPVCTEEDCEGHNGVTIIYPKKEKL